MTRRGYVQLVNDFYSNGKVQELARSGHMDALGVFCMALTYCGDHLTDGFIPRRAMLYIVGATREQIQPLLDVGMFEEVDEGWMIHDYTAHNRSKEQVLHARADAKACKNKSRCHTHVTTVSRCDSAVTSGQTPEHQNTRTPKKEKEEYSSSFSKEETADDYVASPAKQTADVRISRDYPNLDLMDAWGAFMQRHQGATKTTSEWTRLWKGWCQRRATMSNIPASKPHVHTWQCEHVLALLGRDRETAMPDTRACATADQLNRKEQQCSQATNDNKSTD